MISAQVWWGAAASIPLDRVLAEIARVELPTETKKALPTIVAFDAKSGHPTHSRP